MKTVEKQTKSLTDQAEELRLKLKEKETMLRIAKFKLAEVSRNIKHGQLKPIDKPKKDRNASLSPEVGAKPPKRPPVPSAVSLGLPVKNGVRTSS